MPCLKRKCLTETVLVSVDPAAGTEIYCCTYSEDNGKYGFVVIAYEGSGLSKICLEETPYPFDLKEDIEDVMEELKKTDIDLSTDSAVRERINDGSR